MMPSARAAPSEEIAELHGIIRGESGERSVPGHARVYERRKLVPNLTGQFAMFLGGNQHPLTREEWI